MRNILQKLRELTLWQVVAIYLGGAWVILQAADLFIERLGFPAWLFSGTVILLALGLPVVLATAVLQQHTGFTQRLSAAWPKPARSTLTWRNAAFGGVLAFALLGAASVTERAINAIGHDTENWARSTGIPELARAVEDVNWEVAWPLVQRIEGIIPDDSAFNALRAASATRVTYTSEPAGAKVFQRFYSDSDTTWTYLGQTPLVDLWVPNGTSQLRFELAGHRAVQRAGAPSGPPFFRTIDKIALRLDAETAIPAEMVRVPGGTIGIQHPPLEAVPGIELGDYLMDRYEVTNREYKRFVDARGYQRRELWKHAFTREGGSLSWDDGIKVLVDRTGVPGPSTWEAGDYPEGEDDFPVTGVSWYEAAAYAEFVDKALPTVYHWSHAASTPMGAYLVPRSNFSGRAARAVTAATALGWYGTYDQAGNVREWCVNESNGRRYIMGGGWNDAPYHFNDAYAQPPSDRSPSNGIRLVRYLDPKNLDNASHSIELPYRNFLAERPVSDEVFDVFRAQFAYDRKPLDAKVESADSSHPDWIKQRVSFEAAYDAPRMLVDFYLPKRHASPHQVVIFFPPGNALQLSSSKNLPTFLFDFMIKSGRAVAYPIFRGTYERGAGELKSDYPEPTVKWRHYVVMWGQDYRRTHDYLESRVDLDASRIAFYGLSWGGAIGPFMAAVEPRTKAVVLNVGGLQFQRALPEVDAINYVTHVTQPTLMLNGRYDHYFPVETSQKPMFEMLGTPPPHKRHVISEGGHNVPRPQVIRETLGWLDRYLGPVGPTKPVSN